LTTESRLRVLITREEIETAVERLAVEIRKDYRGKDLLLIGILKGSFMFMADLIRHLDLPLEIEFVQLSSYGAGKKSSGRVRMVHGLGTPIGGRDVLVVEDIVDSGITLDFLLRRLRREKPSSLKICTLFDKPSRREVPVPLDYLGFSIPDAFVVGYGLDFDEKFRYLPDLYVVEEETAG
jgi:hypoxanthine phosphoribosyltransferase